MERFVGTWEIDLAGSSRWDADLGAYVPDQVGQEIITIAYADGVQDYEVLYGDDPVVRMGYTATVNGTDWADYAVREIIPQRDGDLEVSLEAFRQRIGANSGTGYRSFVVGECYGQVRVVTLDNRSHLRVARYAESQELQTVMLRRMEDGDHAYLASVMDATGRVYRIRRFVRRRED
jgi:hypothetical protein